MSYYESLPRALRRALPPLTSGAPDSLPYVDYMGRRFASLNDADPDTRTEYRPRTPKGRTNRILEAFRAYCTNELDGNAFARPSLEWLDALSDEQYGPEHIAEYLRDAIGSPASVGDVNGWMDRGTQDWEHARRVLEHLLWHEERAS